MKKDDIDRSRAFRQLIDRDAWFDGIKVGVPIALGYFVVAVALGIQARSAGLTAFQGGLASFLCAAAAGEYAGFSAIKDCAPYIVIILATLVANARYFLMGCALSQRMSPGTTLRSRAMVAFYLTDEIFGVSMLRPGALNPQFVYAVAAIAVPAWTAGTVLGVVAGNALPAQWASALSVALFGMFIAIIVPPGRKNKVVAFLVLASFTLSYIASKAPVTAEWSEGSRTVALTLVLASLAAIFFPVEEDRKSVV